MLYGSGLTPEQAVLAQPLILDPKQGSYYKPVRHADLLAKINTIAEGNNLTLVAARYAMAGNGRQLMAALRYQHANEDKCGYLEHATPWLVLWTGTDRRHKLKLYVGGTTPKFQEGTTTYMPYGFIMSELSHSYNGRPTFTRNADLMEMLAEYIKMYKGRIEYLPRYLARAKARKMDKAEYQELAVQAARDGCLPWSLLGKLDAYWAKAKEWNYAGWMRAYGYAIKSATGKRQLPYQIKMRGLLALYGLGAAPKAA